MKHVSKAEIIPKSRFSWDVILRSLQKQEIVPRVQPMIRILFDAEYVVWILILFVCWMQGITQLNFLVILFL